MNSVPLILAVGSAHDHVWPIMCIRNVDGPEWEMLDIELNRCVDISAIQLVFMHYTFHISVFLMANCWRTRKTASWPPFFDLPCQN
jgi:hypothetical protein